MREEEEDMRREWKESGKEDKGLNCLTGNDI